MSRFSVKERMVRSIALRKGEVVVRADFESMGSPSQISRALKELIEAGKIVRLGYGVYAKARPSTLSGTPVPRVYLEELAQEALEPPMQQALTERYQDVVRAVTAPEGGAA